MFIPLLYRTTLNVAATDRATAHIASVLSFALGVVFMMVYYRLFHVTKTGQQQQHMMTDTLSKVRDHVHMTSVLRGVAKIEEQ